MKCKWCICRPPLALFLALPPLQCPCGGIYNTNLANLAIRDSTLTGNSAASSFSGPRPPCASTAFGGGLFNNGIMTMSNSTLASNGVASGGYSFGGGISNGGTATISNSTLSGNHSSWMSGGIDNGGTAIISNTTLSGNSATAQGGGIRDLGSAIISNSTLSGNAANLGGDIRNLPGLSITLQNTIVANSATGGNCSGTMTSNGYNLSSDGTCNFNRPGDLNNQDPLLGPLQNNGGPTQTLALLSGSHAIDGGNPAGCTDGNGQLLTTDQRGMPRPDTEDKTGCDMGAYENQTGAANSHPLPIDLLQQDLAIGFDRDASASACRPLGSSCSPTGHNSECCSNLCGYRGSCCQLQFRNIPEKTKAMCSRRPTVTSLGLLRRWDTRSASSRFWNCANTPKTSWATNSISGPSTTRCWVAEHFRWTY